jgi:hypothetical protein
MITKDEIEAKAEEFGLHSPNVERDYIFGWPLAGIYSTKEKRRSTTNMPHAITEKRLTITPASG